MQTHISIVEYAKKKGKKKFERRMVGEGRERRREGRKEEAYGGSQVGKKRREGKEMEGKEGNVKKQNSAK